MTDETNNHPAEVNGHTTPITSYCEHHGEYPGEQVQIGSKTISMPCPHCADEKAQRKADEKAAQAAQRAERERLGLHRKSAIPPRFQGSGFDRYEPPNESAETIKGLCRWYAENFQKQMDNGANLVMCGKPGTGKTHLACAIATSAIDDHGRSALYTSATRLSRAIKSTYGGESGQSEDQAIQSFVAPDLLIIDEVGSQRGTETELLLAQEIIDERYQEMRPTIVISNLDESDLVNYIGERALDRMHEGGGAVLPFSWESYRRSNK